MLTLTASDRAAFTAALDLLDGGPTVYPAPGALACALYPRTIQTPALCLLDRNLVDVAEGKTPRLMWTMPPQEGKSQRIARWFPLWLLLRNPDLRIAIVSYELGVARRWGRLIRNEIIAHPELGLRVRPDTAAAHEWELAGHEGGIFCSGIGGPLTGRPVDVLIIDDPVKGRAEADSAAHREAAKEWWQETAYPRLSEATPVVLDMTRWHDDDLGGWLLTEHPDEWKLINIPALADHDPAKGQADVLGRDPGEWLESARRRTPEGWEKRRTNAGARGFQALYQGRPSPDEGNVFKRTGWRYYTQPLWSDQPDGSRLAHDMDEVIQSWDMAFKDLASSDYVVGGVLGRKGADVFLLDLIRARLDFVATCAAVQRLSTRWPQAIAKLVEDKANGTAVISALRQKVPGLIPVNPTDSKPARAAAVSPFQEAGNVWLPKPELVTFDVDGMVEECAAFPNGTHDDQVDMVSQGLHRLLLKPQRARGPVMSWAGRAA